MEIEGGRNHLHLVVDERLEKNTIVVHGQNNSREDIEGLSIGTCQKVYVIGDSNLEAHDSSNMETVRIISDVWRTAHPETMKAESLVLQNRLHCHVLFEYQTMFSVFQFSQLNKEIDGAIHFHPFNLYENWAKMVVVEGKAWADDPDAKIDYLPMEGTEGLREDSRKHVHLIVVGMSRMGTSLAVETAQIAHYPNFKEDDISESGYRG